jgi:arylformamidase
MAIYPSNPPVAFRSVTGASATSSALTEITFGSHTGTHIDAPSHIHNGDASAGVYDLSRFIGHATVCDLSFCRNVIGEDDVAGVTGERVLLKTANSNLSVDLFDESFVALKEAAAHALVAKGILLIGIDGPSIKKRGVHDRVHELFLQAGVVIVEGLYLKGVAAGEYELICLPLPVDLDGAPVRAVLRR